MIFKAKHGLLIAVGLLLVLCLCCLAGVVVYLSLFNNDYLASDGVNASSDVSYPVIKSTQEKHTTERSSTRKPTPSSTKAPKVTDKNEDISDTNPSVIVELDFSDPWNYRITPDKTPLLKEVTGQHKIPPGAENEEGKDILEEVTEEMTTLDTSHTETILKEVDKKLGDSVRSKISCSTCKLGVGLLQAEVKKATPFEETKLKFVSICSTFKIQIPSVCAGLFDMYAPEVLPALNTTKIGVTEICALLIGESCGDVPNPLHEWDVTFPPIPKPALLLSAPPPRLDRSVFKVLQISDTHYDPNYVEGSVANCQEPLCCHIDSTPPDNDSIPIQLAGKWGSYEKCDAPKILIDNVLKDIKEHHPDIDYILWTGDLPPHDIWNQSKAQNLEILKQTLNQIFEAFPDTPIFPALGNHEAIPAGNFPPPWLHEPDHSINWLYTEVAKEWSKWLPESSKNTLLHGGFYSVLIRPGFRLISLNMNYCHTISWWLYVNSTDPASELQWLIYELQEAENKGEKVHIIGHIPPGQSDCMMVWSRNYYKVIDRYEQTVMAQFFGHTHQDEFEVFYDVEGYWRPTSVAYVGPSITTFENNNPGYRIYYVDGDHNETTREVIDHETWILNLEAANNGTEENPSWFMLYSARAAYGMKTLRPRDWDNLINRMVKDHRLFEQFYKFYYRDSPTMPACDTTKCKLEILCDLKSGKSHDRHHLCHSLEEVLTD